MPVVNAETLNIPLYKLADAKAVNMRCTGSEHSIVLPIPKRWKVNKATLNFRYQNSSALLKRTSQLEMLLNDVPLAQIRLDPLSSKGTVKLDLPPVLLESDFNRLTFRVAQHYSTQCENPCAPELWTRIELDDASIELDYEYRDVPLRISAVSDFLFDPKLFPEPQLNIVTETLSDEDLTAATIVASGVALRYEFRKTLFSTSESLEQGKDNVLVGSHEFIKRVMDYYELPYEASGPYLRVLHMPKRVQVTRTNREGKKETVEVTRFDKRFGLILIAGETAEQIKVAAETMDILSIPFPDSAEMQVKGFSMPKIAQYSGKKMLTTDRLYRLNNLNFFSHTFKGMSSDKAQLIFRVPADFRVKPNQYVKLSLDFSFGAGMRADSSLNIILNGNHVNAIHINDEQGGLFNDYEINLPTHLFKGGENILEFEAVLTPLITERCGFIQQENLFLTLFDSSTLVFPSMPHRVEMPNLELLFVNGFPYTRWPDGYETLVSLAAPSRSNLTLALNLVGILTQKNGYPLFGLEVSNQVPDHYDGEVVVVGEVAQVENEWLSRAPLRLGEFNHVPYPVFESWDERSSLAFSIQRSEMGDHQGMITQFESPFKIGRTMTLFTAKTTQGIERLSDALWEFSVQGAARGDLMLIDYVFNPNQFERFGDGRDFRVTALQAGKTFYTGKGGSVNPVQFYLDLYPWLYWVALAVCGALLVLLIYWWLVRQRQRRLAQSHLDDHHE